MALVGYEMIWYEMRCQDDASVTVCIDLNSFKSRKIRFQQGKTQETDMLKVELPSTIFVWMASNYMLKIIEMLTLLFILAWIYSEDIEREV